MKEIILVYGNDCFDSKNAISLIENLKTEKPDFTINKILFSFQEPLVRKFRVMFTPTFIINQEIAFVGTPAKEQLIEKINQNL